MLPFLPRVIFQLDSIFHGVPLVVFSWRRLFSCTFVMCWSFYLHLNFIFQILKLILVFSREFLFDVPVQLIFWISYRRHFFRYQGLYMSFFCSLRPTCFISLQFHQRPVFRGFQVSNLCPMKHKLFVMGCLTNYLLIFSFFSLVRHLPKQSVQLFKAFEPQHQRWEWCLMKM